ncbi:MULTISPECIES: type VII secretion system-associated protein [unclassified Saccharopolyspora]|uniref:type VII secretion system-associated protein n=1 Tax=unclassified Saccharopolyspora TaxID=2646250 RepID=UPI001CD1E05E|nr:MULTISPECIES: type VII secretion system-associated protein [unclassified Saccharopolyspora]MCA1185261.1 type VII secretion system-associated protein [Saccharopolyspora sp. 6T]MCA1191288.1 type VII secretion system-associated protein [Saccharopolyspora sp. 6V]MCA1225111.1 type VII secretion system-associated protein [Saccharopolyspora sp. 6M]MCA1280955.1 type VII secretion system-associated protein [Saccharopolyspora sp. 7B]
MPDTGESRFYLLMDPGWAPSAAETEPPVEAIMGLWPAAEDGGLGRFRPNPGYAPTDPDAPADPLDGLFRMLTARRAEPDQLRLLLHDSELEVALGRGGGPLVVRSPDDVPCLLVATSPHYRLGSEQIGSWWRTGVDGLADLIPEGTDVLFNPGSPGSLRLVAGFVRSAREPSAEQRASARAGLPTAAGEQLRLLAWPIDPAEESR